MAAKKFINYRIGLTGLALALIFVIGFAGFQTLRPRTAKDKDVNAATLKPQLSGVLDRQNAPGSTYEGVVNAYIVDTTWASVQPTQGGAIASGNEIDKALSYVRTKSGKNIRLKLRVRAGSEAPAWAKNLPVTSGKQGPFNICDNHGSSPHCGSVGHFWESNFKAAYAELQTKLAAKYDSEPEIQEVDIVGCTTIFEEPFLRQGNLQSNVDAYKAAGYNEAANKTCIQDAMKAHQVWAQTRSSESYNPYSEFNGSSFSVNENFTEQMVTYCRQQLGQRCVLGNDSIGKASSTTSYACSEIGNSSWASKTDYFRMYTVIKCAGKPIYFQTATMAKIGTAGLQDALNFAIGVGAGMVELPSGYEALALSSMSGYDKSLESNALPGGGTVTNAPAITFSASPASITSGNASTLTWSVAGTTPTCTASGGWTGSKSISGTQTVSPTNTTTYTLACTNSAGSDAKSATVTVTSGVIAPVVTLSASPASISSGSSSTLTWSTTGTSPACTASGGWTGSKTASGSQTVTPVATTTYTLTCSNSAGNNAKSATVTVNSAGDTTPPTVSLTAPANGATVSGNSVSLAATASDNAAVSKVEFFIDNNLVGSDNSSPYSFSWNSTSTGDGSHTVKATATDSSNLTASSSRTVTVNNSAQKPGDCNGDNAVDVFDLSILLANYNQSKSGYSNCDFNGDNMIDVFDLSIMLGNYGK